MAANDRQEGGNHYKQFRGAEPWDIVTFWGLGYLDGTAVKYLARWRHKNGLEDLRKAKHYIEKQIEVEEARKQPPCVYSSGCDMPSACTGLGQCRGKARAEKKA